MRYKAVPWIKKVTTHGMNMDIHKEQAGTAGTAEHRRMMAVYERAKQYPNETEACYSFVQVLTACVNCTFRRLLGRRAGKKRAGKKRAEKADAVFSFPHSVRSRRQ